MIIDANGPLLMCLARECGIEIVDRQLLRDDRAAIALAIHAGLEQADMVVVSGGVSVGDFDYVTQALEDAGLSVHFTTVAIKPGRPTTYASADGRAVFGLPGNPVSTFVIFELLVKPFLFKLMRHDYIHRDIPLSLEQTVKRKKNKRQSWIPVIITPTEMSV